MITSDTPEGVEKIDLEQNMPVGGNPVADLLKYMVHLDAQRVYALVGKDQKLVETISKWFDTFESALRTLLADESIRLTYEPKIYNFMIHQANRDPYNLNQLPDGYSAAIQIVADLMMRMDHNWLINGGELDLSTEGVALIDEVETHLHLELRKNILPFLTKLFPNIQFIVTTHSPFLVNSLDNVAIFDLENQTIIKNGLANASYEGVVEGYYKVDKISRKLRNVFDEYKTLVSKDILSDDDLERLAKLEFYLDEIPDFLNLNIATEYKRLRLELRERM